MQAENPRRGTMAFSSMGWEPIDSLGGSWECEGSIQMKRLIIGILGFLSLVPLAALSVAVNYDPPTPANGDVVLEQVVSERLYLGGPNSNLSIEVQPWMKWFFPLVTVIYAILLLAVVFGRDRAPGR